MRKLLLVAAFALVCSSLAFATTYNEELYISSGASNATVTNPTGPTVSYSNLNFNGWDILATIGISQSPGLSPYGLDVITLTASCALPAAGCATQALDIWFGDTNFTTQVGAGGFVNDFTSTESGGGASATQYAWDDTTNTLLGTGTAIGTVGPFTGTGPFSGSKSGGGPAGPSSYALTLEDVVSAGGSVSYDLGGQVLSVPEPTSIVLFGTILSLAGFAFRRKLAKKS